MIQSRFPRWPDRDKVPPVPGYYRFESVGQLEFVAREWHTNTMSHEEYAIFLLREDLKPPEKKEGQ